MHRFFLNPQSIQENRVVFPPQTARQMSRVLHVRLNERVIVLDNTGLEFVVRIETLEPDSAQGVIEKQNQAAAEPAVTVVLFPALCQREKFEWILQKCTEIGVSAFHPIRTARSLVTNPAEVALKYDRWQRILQEAAEQSGRGRIPVLYPPLNYPEAILQAAGSYSLNLFLWEGEKHSSLSDAVQAWKSSPAGIGSGIGLWIGPEGGFTAEEVSAAVNAGAVPVTLGSRILRMETAAMVGAALVLHDLSQMG